LIREAQIALAAGNAAGSVVSDSGLYRRDSTEAGYRAFMEPSGRNPWQRWQIRAPRKGLKFAKPLPWVATGYRGNAMVRTGSTVRVRQRALQNPPQISVLHTRRTIRSEQVDLNDKPFEAAVELG
jgi:hypothetical protein